MQRKIHYGCKKTQAVISCPSCSAEEDEELGGQQEDLKGKVAFPELFVLPHSDTAIIMDMTPEIAADVCPHIPEILHAAHPEPSAHEDLASSSGASSH